ncbi:unnamed protein product [Schistosoma mattheei]|uniref:Uncharacterized protein n=1 Tax=Schistosoma mattheei TaxID=31246 RepID=A0A183P7Q6_9TREM|nr:unnamed protein product [Schistosoma mattheei]
MEVFRVIAKSEEITESYMNRHSEQINKSHCDAQDYRHFSEFDKVIIQEMYTENSLAPTIHNRVLCAIDNIVHRIYHTYELLVFDMEPTVISDYDSNESDEKKLLDLLSQVIRLSVHLAEESMQDQDEYVLDTFKRKLTGILNNIRQVRPELIPQQETSADNLEPTFERSGSVYNHHHQDFPFSPYLHLSLNVDNAHVATSPPLNILNYIQFREDLQHSNNSSIRA